jgi:hypothetical protein
MAKKVWMHIDSVIKSGDDATKKLLTKSLEKALGDATRDAIIPLLPSNVTTKAADKPKGIAKKWNALKLTATHTVTIEARSTSSFVKCEVRILMEVIKTPDLVRGQFVGGGSKGAGMDGRGADEAAFVRIAKGTFAHFMRILMTEVIRGSRLRAKQVGFEF